MNMHNQNVINRVGGVILEDTGRPTDFERFARNEMIDIDFDEIL